MKLNILFNYPLGENSANFSLGMPNVNDKEYTFRVGIIEESDSKTIKWLSPGWVRYGETQNLKGFIKKGDTIVVEKKREGNEEIVGRISVNSREKWPAEADGGSSADIGFTF